MRFEEHDCIVTTRDFTVGNGIGTEYRTIPAGTAGVIVHCYQTGAYEVEFFNQFAGITKCLHEYQIAYWKSSCLEPEQIAEAARKYETEFGKASPKLVSHLRYIDRMIQCLEWARKQS
jgi:hypothetical protein